MSTSKLRTKYHSPGIFGDSIVLQRAMTVTVQAQFWGGRQSWQGLGVYT